jgi:energy-coupling factor transport system ATP-binding protein
MSLLHPSNFGIAGKDLRKKVTESLKLVGLDENIVSKSPFSLSNGHMRLVALAGIIAASPKYLVLDEPSTGLDPKSRNELFKALREIHATGINRCGRNPQYISCIAPCHKGVFHGKGKDSF